MRLVLDAAGRPTPAPSTRGSTCTIRTTRWVPPTRPDSPWRSWYCFDTAGQYQGWKGHMHLPVLDYRAPGLRERVYAGPNAILRHWMRAPYPASTAGASRP